MFSVTRVSNSDMFLSKKDLDSVEFNIILRHTLDFEQECDTAPLQQGCDLDQEQVQEPDQEEQEGKCEFLISKLDVKLPSHGDFKTEKGNDDEEDNEGFKTPTSLDQKTPLILQCPPAPRKPKSLPSSKRKFPRQRILLDLSNEIESLFPPAFLADLGGKIKKVRQENEKGCS